MDEPGATVPSILDRIEPLLPGSIESYLGSLRARIGALEDHATQAFARLVSMRNPLGNRIRALQTAILRDFEESHALEHLQKSDAADEFHEFRMASLDLLKWSSKLDRCSFEAELERIDAMMSAGLAIPEILRRGADLIDVRTSAKEMGRDLLKKAFSSLPSLAERIYGTPVPQAESLAVLYEALDQFAEWAGKKAELAESARRIRNILQFEDDLSEIESSVLTAIRESIERQVMDSEKIEHSTELLEQMHRDRFSLLIRRLAAKLDSPSDPGHRDGPTTEENR